MSAAGALMEFWSARSARERAILAAGGLVIGAAVLYAFLWEPGLAARERLSAALPRLRAQAEDMRQQQKEIAALRTKLGAAPQRADLGTLLRTSAARAPFAKSVERIEPLSADRAVLLAAPLEFDAWLEWIETLQRELGIRLDACRIVALEQPGLVRLEATFAAAARVTP